MRPEFWHDRWRSGQIGFHQAAPDRNLVAHFPSLKLAAGSSVFVPLCGKSLDLLWLCEQGYKVTGVEISPIALEALCAEHGIPARRVRVGLFNLYEAPNLRLLEGDFFALTPELLGSVDAVYDRAAAIAFDASQRPAYVEKLARLLAPGTRMLLITVEYPQAEMTGPPFSLERPEVERLYAPHFEIREIARADQLAYEPRMRARGVTAWHEVCYFLTRF